MQFSLYDQTVTFRSLKFTSTGYVESQTCNHTLCCAFTLFETFWIKKTFVCLLRVLTKEVIVINKYAYICSEVLWIKFIKTACVQEIKQVNKRMF